jgi:hypothetical protein
MTRCPAVGRFLDVRTFYIEASRSRGYYVRSPLALHRCGDQGACVKPLEPSFKPFGLRHITQVLRVLLTVHTFRCSPLYRHAVVPFGFRR